ncbi:hypothetical protein Emed_007388 [Eimeria media]
MSHAKATLDNAVLPSALKMHQDSLELYSSSSSSSSARVQAQSPRTSGYQTQEIAELCRMATAIESLLSSSTKCSTKEDNSKEQPVVGATADLPSNSELKPPAEPASSTKPQNRITEESSDTPHPPAKRDARALEEDCELPGSNEQNQRTGCRPSSELVKKPRVGVMTNVLLLICRRNAGSLSPDQCASATANYFCTFSRQIAREDEVYLQFISAAKKGGSTADFEAALDSVKQLRPIFCPKYFYICLQHRSSRIRLTKTENPEKEVGKGGQGQVEYGSSWQPLLNELRASSEHQKNQSETRAPPKRRNSQANAETDEASRTQQSEGAPAQEATREVCKHEEGSSTASRRISKDATTGQPQPSAAPPTPQEASSQAKQHDLRTNQCVQQAAPRVKPESLREPLDDGQGNEERSKRQRRATFDSASTTGSSRHSLQPESDAHFHPADVHGSKAAAAGSQLISQDAELGPQQTAKKTSVAATVKEPPQCCPQASLASSRIQQSAPSSTAQQNTLQTAQQNRAKKNGGGSSQSAGQEQTRRYNTRSRGVIKNER